MRVLHFVHVFPSKLVSFPSSDLLLFSSPRLLLFSLPISLIITTLISFSLPFILSFPPYFCILVSLKSSFAVLLNMLFGGSSSCSRVAILSSGGGGGGPLLLFRLPLSSFATITTKTYLAPVALPTMPIRHVADQFRTKWKRSSKTDVSATTESHPPSSTPSRVTDKGTAPAVTAPPTTTAAPTTAKKSAKTTAGPPPPPNPDYGLRGIGEYQFVEALGQGKFSKVVLARHYLTGEKVAIKVTILL